MHSSILVSRPARVFALGLMLACPVFAAGPIYMRIGAAPKGGTLRFRILRWDAPTEATRESARLRTLTITKELGKESAQLHVALTANRVLPEVAFEFCHTTPDGAEQVYLTIKLTNALITRIRELAGGSGSGERRKEAEEISLTFQKIEWIHSSSAGGKDNWSK